MIHAEDAESAVTAFEAAFARDSFWHAKRACLTFSPRPPRDNSSVGACLRGSA